MASTIAYPHCRGDASKSALPQFNIRYRGKVDSFVARTQMDTGEVRSRQRYSLQKEVVGVTLELDHIEMDFWRNWVLYTLAQGTRSFNAFLPLGGDVAHGSGLTEKEVTIVGGTYNHNYIDHMHHRVTFSLEFVDTSTISPDLFSVYTDLSDESDPCDNFNLSEFESAVETAQTGVAVLDVYTRDTLPTHILPVLSVPAP